MWRAFQTVVGLLLSLGVALLPLGTWGRRLLPGRPLAGAEVLWWVAVGVLLAYVTLVERRPLSSIGFRGFGWRSLLAGFVTGILLVLGVILIYSIVFPALHLRVNTGQMSRLLDTPFWYRFALVTRAAVAEETLFRGYPIPRLEELTGSTFAAALLSWAAFTIAHLGSWGWAQLIVAGFGGILLGALFVWRRNLWINMIAHWIGDSAGFLLPH